YSIFINVGKYAIAKLPSIKEEGRKINLKNSIILISLISSVITAGIFYLLSDFIFSILFGSAFLESVIIFKILSGGLIFFVIFNTMQAIIIAEAKCWLIVISALISTLTVLIFS